MSWRQQHSSKVGKKIEVKEKTPNNMMTIHPRQRKIQTSKKISANKRAKNNFPQPLAEPKKKTRGYTPTPHGGSLSSKRSLEGVR